MFKLFIFFHVAHTMGRTLTGQPVVLGHVSAAAPHALTTGCRDGGWQRHGCCCCCGCRARSMLLGRVLASCCTPHPHLVLAGAAGAGGCFFQGAAWLWDASANRAAGAQPWAIVNTS